MMNALARIDEWVLGKVEKGCHAIQRQFGITNYKLMSMVNLLIVGTIFAMVAYGTSVEIPEKYIVTHLVIQHRALMVIFVAMELCAAFWWQKDREAAAFDRLLRGLANPQKIDRGHRLFRLFGYFFVPDMIFDLGISLDSSFIFFLFTYVVLWACDPLPPCRGRFWERLEVAFARFARASSS